MLYTLKTWLPLCIISYNFAIQHHFIRLKFQGIIDFWKLARKVQTIAGIQLYFVITSISDGAITIPLYLKSPFFTVKGLLTDFTKHRHHRLGKLPLLPIGAACFGQ